MLLIKKQNYIQILQIHLKNECKVFTVDLITLSCQYFLLNGLNSQSLLKNQSGKQTEMRQTDMAAQTHL